MRDGADARSSLFDRDTTTRFPIAAPRTLAVPAGDEIKLHSPRNLRVEFNGEHHDFKNESGWVTISAARVSTLTLSALGSDASLAELEVWGAQEKNPLPIDMAGGEVTLVPAGQTGASPCATLDFAHDVVVTDVLEAHLVLEVDGTRRMESLQFGLNSVPLREALWIDTPGTATLTEELDPRNLLGSRESVRVCLADAANRTVTIRAAHLRLTLDDGWHWLHRETREALPLAVDGDTATSAPFQQGQRLLTSRTLDVSALSFGGSSQGELTAEFEAAPSVTKTLSVSERVSNTSVAARDVTAVKLDAHGAVRTDVPAGVLAEFRFVGSPTGARVQKNELALAYPANPKVEADGLHVSHFGGAALVSGWALGPGGAARVSLDAAPVSSADGSFSVVVHAPATGAAWVSVLHIDFANGESRDVSLNFDGDLLPGLIPTTGATAPNADLFGRENETVSATFGANGGTLKLGERVELAVPQGALAQDTSLSITHAMEEAVPPLDAAMVNVTAPANAGYRFLPHGQQFAQPVLVTLPYDATLLPEGMSPLEIQTYFYDEQLRHWVALTRKEVRQPTQQVVSETTHFTFMINAVLVTPESPQVASFNPTSLKDLKAATPAEGFDLVELADPGNTGSARLQLPLRLPKARGDFQPQLALTWDSQGGNGMLGLGWSLTSSAITVDTRFGVPDYNAPRYLLDGAQLVPTGQGSGGCVEFKRRQEGDFSFIQRCGSSPTAFTFTVITKAGVTYRYGVDDESRVRSSAAIAEWHLASVTDKNGNQTTFLYEHDEKVSGVDDAHGEPFTWLYPRGIAYTSNANTAASARFFVNFVYEQTRGDLTSSGRYGFKTLLRRRLTEVRVCFGGTLLRTYVVTYETGDFGKSLLKTIALQGNSHATLAMHEFEYEKKQPLGFGGDVDTWSISGDGRRISSSVETSGGGSVYVGIGFTAAKIAGSVGVRAGFHLRASLLTDTLVDFNGDRIPDRISPYNDLDNKPRLLLGDKHSKRFSAFAPPSDPNLDVAGAQVPPAGVELGTSLDFAAQGMIGPVTASLGVAFSLNAAPGFLTDADGDGLVDFFAGGQVRFNARDGGTVYFTEDRPLPVSADTPDSLASREAGDAGSVSSRQTPEDVLVEWIAPFGGEVDVSGVWGFVRPTVATPGRDGVRLRIYLARGDQTLQLADFGMASGEVGDRPITATTTLATGERLYFRLSSGIDVPILAPRDGGDPVPLEEVRVLPKITYRCSDGTTACQSMIGADGRPIYVFDLQNDFRAEGRPSPMIQVQQRGTLQLTWTIAKPQTQDEVMFCTLRGPADGGGVNWLAKSCEAESIDAGFNGGAGSMPVFTLAAASTGTTAQQIVTVEKNQPLSFMLESHYSQPLSTPISARVKGVMTSVCDDQGNCHQTSAQEQAVMRFELDAYQPVHRSPSELSGPPREGLVIPEDGTLVVQSHMDFARVCQFPESCSPIWYVVRSDDDLYARHTENEWVVSSRGVSAGTRVFAEAHSELEVIGSEGWADTAWSLSAWLVVQHRDGGTETRPLDIPRGRTGDVQIQPANNSQLYDFNALDPSPIAGGFHSWHFGTWLRPESEEFDARLLRPDAGDYTAPALGGSEDEQRRSTRAQARDGGSFERTHLSAFSSMIPKSDGTTSYRLTFLEDGGTQQVPDLGLKPDVRSFISSDKTAWVASDGTWHASKAAASTGAAKVAGRPSPDFDTGGAARLSLGVTFSAGVGLGMGGLGINGSGSVGFTNQLQDFMDLNGDGLLDTVGPLAMKLTDRHDLHQTEYPLDVPLLRSNKDFGFNVGMGASPTTKIQSAKGDTKGEISVGANIGGGFAVNVGTSDVEMLDFNGDGLPDIVGYFDIGGARVFGVRLNLGGKFGALDVVSLPAWSSGTPTSISLHSGAATPPEGEEDAGYGDTDAVASGLQNVLTPDQARRYASSSLNGSLGVSAESGSIGYGGGITIESSISGTEVAFIDVTGDGLPDSVKRLPDGGAGLVARVNYGYGFGPETIISMPSWGDGQGPTYALPGYLTPGSTGVLTQDVLQKAQDAFGLQADGLLEASGGYTMIPSTAFFVTFTSVLSPVGTPWLHITVGADISPMRVSGFDMGFMDIDGDGFADHVLKRDGFEDATSRSLFNVPESQILVRHNEMAGGNLLKRVKRPLGGSISLEYSREGNTVDMPESRWTLARATYDDGTALPGDGHRLTTTWQYSGGKYDRSERDFFGFAQVQSMTGDGVTTTRLFDVSSTRKKGLLQTQISSDASGNVLSKTLNTYDVPQSQNQPQANCTSTAFFAVDWDDYCTATWVPLKTTESTVFEGVASKTTRQRFTGYDTFGNVTGFSDDGDVDDPSDNLTATVTYDSVSSSMPPGLAADLLVFDSSGNTVRERHGDYDNGNLKKLRNRISVSEEAVTDFIWNPDGTLKTVTAPENAAGQRNTLTYEYDTDVSTWPTRVTDALGYSSSSTWDVGFGVELTTTDANNQVTTRTYDEFGRLECLRGPKEGIGRDCTIKVDYRTAAPAVAVTSNMLPRASGTPHYLEVSTFLDGLGRVRQTKTTARVYGVGRGMVVSGNQRFDVMGRVVQQGQPFFSHAATATLAGALDDPRNPTVFGYDIRGRVTETTEPNGAHTLVGYGIATPPGESLARLVTQTTDANRHVREAYSDVVGKTVAVTEYPAEGPATTRYAYAATGELLTVSDAESHVTSMTYDLLGRRLTLSNPDTGLIQTTYDPAGHVVTRMTPGLRAGAVPIRYEYNFNQLRRIDYPVSQDVTFEYGAPGAMLGQAGRIARVVDEVGEETREYGSLGELTRQTRTVRPLRPGDLPQTMSLAFEWDSFGRMLAMQYPDGELLQYTYDEGGLLVSASGTRGAEVETYVSTIEYDEFGQRRRMKLGNGVETKYDYDALTRRPAVIASSSPAAGVFQNLVYDYDPVGNVKTLANTLGAPVPRHFGGASSFTFGYDALDRLQSASGSVETRQGIYSRFNAGYSYSPIHNMQRAVLTQSVLDSGGPHEAAQGNRDETYVYDAQHPHRALQIGEAAFSYDDDGNTTSECGTPCNAGHRKLYAWDEDGKLTQATVAGHLTRYLYDSGGQRVAKLKPNGPQVTLGQWWTSSGNSHATKHIFAGGQRIATKLLPAATVVTNMPPGNMPGGGWPNTNGCIPSGNQPQKCVETTPGSGVWVQQGNIRPATWYFHSDMLGSTGWLTTEDGGVHERVEYFPYGEVWRQSNGSGTQRLRQQFLYTGKEFDEETGLTYFGARYYDSRYARWLSTDPMLLAQTPVSLSVYHYSGSNPLRYRDADGNCYDVATAGYSISMCKESARAGWGYVKGVVNVAASALKGSVDMIAPGVTESFDVEKWENPQLYYAKKAEANQALGNAVLHPIETASKVKASVEATIESGDSDRIGELTGEVVGTAALLASAKAKVPTPAPEALELGEELAAIARGSRSRRPAVVVGATSTETGATTTGRSFPGQAGCCAEVDAASRLGGDPRNVRFTKPVRPGTGQVIPVCRNCQRLFDRSQFPDGTPFE